MGHNSIYTSDKEINKCMMKYINTKLNNIKWKRCFKIFLSADTDLLFIYFIVYFI